MTVKCTQWKCLTCYTAIKSALVIFSIENCTRSPFFEHTLSLALSLQVESLGLVPLNSSTSRYAEQPHRLGYFASLVAPNVNAAPECNEELIHSLFLAEWVMTIKPDA